MQNFNIQNSPFADFKMPQQQLQKDNVQTAAIPPQKQDEFVKSDKDTKKPAKAAGIIAAIALGGAALLYFIKKGKINTPKNPPGDAHLPRIITSETKGGPVQVLQDTADDLKGAAANMQDDLLKNGDMLPDNPDVLQQKAPQMISDINEAVSGENPQKAVREQVSEITQETAEKLSQGTEPAKLADEIPDEITRQPAAVLEAPKPEEEIAKTVQEAAQKIDIPELKFDDEIYNGLKKYEKAILSGTFEVVPEEVFTLVKKEQEAIGQAYDDLMSIVKNTDDEAVLDEISKKISALQERYKSLNVAERIEDIQKLKSELDKIDPAAYKKVFEKTGSGGMAMLESNLIGELGARRFKTSPVYREIIDAADKLGLEGSEDEKIKKIMKLAEENKLGSGEHGTVYQIPGTKLAIKAPGRNGKPPQSLEGFSYLADISEYQAVNNVLARNNLVEIQEYIDSLKSFVLSDEYDTIVANMPQSAYDDLLARVVRINKAGRGLDVGGNNLMVDAINQRFVPIDLHPNTSFEAGYRTKIDHLGRNYIDPLGHTIGQFTTSLDNTSTMKRVGKALKSIAKDTENYKMYLFDTSFYSSRYNDAPRRIIYEYLEQVDEGLAREIDEAFDKMHKIKLELGDSANEADRKTVKDAIDEFCALVDKKLLKEPDIAPEELAKMQISANRTHLIDKFDAKIEKRKESLEEIAALDKEDRTDYITSKLQELEKERDEALAAYDKKYGLI